MFKWDYPKKLNQGVKAMAKHKSEESSYKLVPEGKYLTRISKVEVQPGSKDKKAKVAHFTFTIREGKRAKSTVKNFYNMKNKNQEAVDIAHGELSHLAFCCGMKNWDDEKLKKFVGNDVTVDVSIDGKYNKIDKFYSPEVSAGKKGKKKNKKKDW